MDDGNGLFAAGDIGDPIMEVREGVDAGCVAVEDGGEAIARLAKWEVSGEASRGPVGRRRGGCDAGRC